MKKQTKVPLPVDADVIREDQNSKFLDWLSGMPDATQNITLTLPITMTGQSWVIVAGGAKARNETLGQALSYALETDTPITDIDNDLPTKE